MDKTRPTQLALVLVAVLVPVSLAGAPFLARPADGGGVHLQLAVGDSGNPASGPVPPQSGGLFTVERGGYLYSASLLVGGELSAMESRVGVRDQSADYNVLVQGHGTGLAPPTAGEWAGLSGGVVIHGLLGETGGGPRPAAPSSYDLSTQQYFPPVGDQGSQGSCAAFALTYYAYGYLEAKDLGWDAASGGAIRHLSPAWTFNKASGGGDSSSILGNGWVLRDWGCSTWNALPYDESEYGDWGNDTAWREAPAHRTSGVMTVAFDGAGDSTVATVKSLVASDTPVVFAVKSAGNFGGAGFTGDWIMSSADYSAGTPDHAQCIVGYDDSVTDDGETGAFRVVNSWGTSWGDSGFYWLTYDAFKEIGYDLGLTYVEDRVDYEPRLVATWRYDPGPNRNASEIRVGIGPKADPVDTLIPWYRANLGANQFKFPGNMTLDLTDFLDEWQAGTGTFFLDNPVACSTEGTITSFEVEYHENAYSPGSPTRVSGESPDVPMATPGHVEVILQTVPSVPGNFSGHLGGGAATLNWTAPESSGGSPVTGYDLYREVDGKGYSLLASLGNVTGYVDADFEWGESHNYTVGARNAIGEGQLAGPVYLDLVPPRVSVYAPVQGAKYHDPPNYSIAVVDADLLDAWYRAVGTDSNFSLPAGQLNGTCDGSLWDVLPAGAVTLEFWANDTSGNFAVEQVRIFKTSAPAGPLSEAARAYITFATLLCLAVVVTGLLVHKR
ncbi:MAG: C1 family peptidase [Promethearchaeota archaeon]